MHTAAYREFLLQLYHHMTVTMADEIALVILGVMINFEFPKYS